MQKHEFASLLDTCTRQCVDFARTLLIDPLPGSVTYHLIPNSSYDGNSLHENETVYPNDSLPTETCHEMNAGQVVDFLWRDGAIPEWVDLCVIDATESHTIVELLCCGRFTTDESLLYYNHANAGPFGVKGPAFPPGYDRSAAPGAKFKLFNPRDLRAKSRQDRGSD